jgi:hypothetical protein
MPDVRGIIPITMSPFSRSCLPGVPAGGATVIPAEFSPFPGALFPTFRNGFMVPVLPSSEISAGRRDYLRASICGPVGHGAKNLEESDED